MKKLTNITFVLLVSTLASIVHGSALQRLKRIAAIATKLAKPRALHKESIRNICNETEKSQWIFERGFINGKHRIAKNAALGIAVGTAATIPYIAGYGLMDGYKDRWDSLLPISIGFSLSVFGPFLAGGPVGFGAFWGPIAAVGCARAAKIKLEQHHAAQAKEAK